MKISVIFITYERPEELLLALESVVSQTRVPDEVIVVDNSNTDSVSESFSQIGTEIGVYDFPICYKRMEENLGVAGGRNKGIELSSGDVNVFLDDDAVFFDNSVLEKTEIEFEKDPALGVIAYKSIDYHSGEVRPWELPIRNKAQHSIAQEVSYYVGVGHAIRKDVFSRVGRYSVDSLYGAEELDLSYRIMETNYSIMYFPDMVVRHMKADVGRAPMRENLVSLIDARLTISIRYFPLWIAFPSSFAYLMLVMLSYKTIGLRLIAAAINPWIKLMKGEINRNLLTGRAIKRIRSLEGRVFY